jgi:predicted RNase H-like HicB family nuclease
MWYNTAMSDAFEFKIEYEADKETGQVVATIPELNHVSSYGDTFAEAEANVREAALGYIEVLMKENKEVPSPAFRTEGTYLKLFVPKIA